MVRRVASGFTLQAMAFAPVLVAVLAACENMAVSRGSGSFSVRDSSGVLIASNSGPDEVLEPVEVLRFGVVEGDPTLQFDLITALDVDRAGGIWVCDSNESIRYYTSSGELQAELGGRGEGPGETPSRWAGVWVGEHSILTDAGRNVLQTFDSGGSLLGSRSNRAGPLQTLLPLGPSSEEWMFYRRDLPALERLPAPETWVVGRGPGNRNDFDSLFALRGMPHSGEKGVRWWGNGSFFDGTPSIGGDGAGRVYYSDPFAYRIEVYASSGHLERVIRRAVEPRPYDEALEEEVEAGVRRSFEILAPRTSNLEDAIQTRVRWAMPSEPPPHLPFLDLILISDAGDIWAQRADTHTHPAMRAVASSWGLVRWAWLDEWKAERQFDLFSPEGRYRGTVVLPVDFTPLAVTADRVYGFMTDRLDVEYVTVFAVELDP